MYTSLIHIKFYNIFLIAVVWINVPLPKVHVLNAWSPGCCYWEAVEPLAGGDEWKVLGSLRVCPWKGLWDHGLFSFSMLPGCEVSSLLCHSFSAIIIQAHQTEAPSSESAQS
jgi:hypothetical protein